VLPSRFMAPLADLLKDRGMRVTAQRVVIHDALMQAGRHLTAEQVRERVHDRLPGVSLPTVYATLELLEELELVTKVHTPSALLFDPRPDRHAHALCRGCGKVEDLDAHSRAKSALKAAGAQGWTGIVPETLVVGYCAECSPG
jgi:Fe2+ or Zn2+ uptake regulation protein